MRLRDWMNNNSAVATIGAVVLLLIALVILLWSNGMVGGPTKYTKAYFWDVKTHKIFIGPLHDIPPIDAPSGKNNGVKAHVFSCTDCSDASTRFTGWLQRYSLRAKKMLENPNAIPSIGANDDLIKLPNPDAQWISAESPAARTIIASIRTHCPAGQKVKRCFP